MDLIELAGDKDYTKALTKAREALEHATALRKDEGVGDRRAEALVDDAERQRRREHDRQQRAQPAQHVEDVLEVHRRHAAGESSTSTDSSSSRPSSIAPISVHLPGSATAA